MNNPKTFVETRNEHALVLAAQDGDAGAIRRLAEQYTALIVSLSGRFYLGAHALLAREELIQAGYVGLLDAIAHYDIEKQTALSTYALSWILGEMRRTVKRSVEHAGGYEEIRRIRRVQAGLEAQNNAEPTIGEIAAACDMPIWQTAALMQMAEIMRIEDQQAELPAQLDKAMEDRVAFRMALDALEAQERQVVLLRYYRGMSQTETAKTMGKSQTQISRIERRAMDHMKTMLT